MVTFWEQTRRLSIRGREPTPCIHLEYAAKSKNEIASRLGQGSMGKSIKFEKWP